MQRFFSRRNLTTSLLAAGLMVTSSTALASGFAAARLGGIHGNPVSVSPASIYWNPGAMAFIDGNELMLDATFAYRTATYEKFEGDVGQNANLNPTEIEANTGEGSVANLITSPALAFVSDLGGTMVRIGAGFYAPYGGQAVWDNQDAPDAYPVARDGAQRWFTIDGTIRQLTGSLGAAVQSNDGRLGIGLTLNLNIFQIDTIRARTAAGTDEIETGDGIVEGRSQLVADSIDLGLGLGVLYQIIPDRLIIGASWQSASNITGRQDLEGTLTNQFGGGATTETNVLVHQRMPQTFRLGLAYRFLDSAVEEGAEPVTRAELRLTGEMLTWNNFDSQCIVPESALNGRSARDVCGVDSDGVSASDEITQNLVRDWNLGWGIKISGSYFVNPNIELAAGLGYDSNAIPDSTLDPALMDMGKVALDLGGRFTITDWLAIGAQFSNVFYTERDNRGNPSLTQFPGSNRQPSGAAVYNQNIFLTNVNAHFLF